MCLGVILLHGVIVDESTFCYENVTSLSLFILIVLQLTILGTFLWINYFHKEYWLKYAAKWFLKAIGPSQRFYHYTMQCITLLVLLVYI